MARKQQIKQPSEAQVKTPRSRRKTVPPPASPPPQREPWTPWGKWAKRRRERIEQKRREREERRRLKREARMRRRIRRRRITARGTVFIALMAFACGVGFLVLVLLGRPYPWETFSDMQTLIGISERLEERRARWQSLAVRNYRVDVTYESREALCGPTTLEIRNSQIVKTPSTAAPSWSPPETCNRLLNQLTIDSAFESVVAEIQQFEPGRSYLRAEFDADFGHPIYVEVSVYDPEDWTPGCCWRATWKNLVLISP